MRSSCPCAKERDPLRLAVKAIMTPGQQFVFFRRLCCSAAICFLFFLVFSTPHRVHHLHEQLPSPKAHPINHANAHDHADHSDRSVPNHQPAAKPNDCVVLSVAQGVHVSLVAPFDLPVFETAAAGRVHHLVLKIKSYSTTPRSPRAPPRV